MMLASGTRLSLAMAALLLLVVILGLGRLFVFPLAQAYWSNQQELKEKSAILERYRSILKDVPLLEQELAERHDGDRAGILYLTGPTHGLAGAELQDRVRTAIANASSDIESTEMLPVVAQEDESFLDHIGLRVQFSTSTSDLGEIIHDLESRRPFLYLDKLVVTKKEINNSNDDTDHSHTISVTLDVFGLLPK